MSKPSIKIAINISRSTPRLTITGISFAIESDSRNMPFSSMTKPTTWVNSFFFVVMKNRLMKIVEIETPKNSGVMFPRYSILRLETANPANNSTLEITSE
jgi:hypothetical protein